MLPDDVKEIYDLCTHIEAVTSSKWLMMLTRYAHHLEDESMCLQIMQLKRLKEADHLSRPQVCTRLAAGMEVITKTVELPNCSDEQLGSKDG